LLFLIAFELVQCQLAGRATPYAKLVDRLGLRVCVTYQRPRRLEYRRRRHTNKQPNSNAQIMWETCRPVTGDRSRRRRWSPAPSGTSGHKADNIPPLCPDYTRTTTRAEPTLSFFPCALSATTHAVTLRTLFFMAQLPQSGLLFPVGLFASN